MELAKTNNGRWQSGQVWEYQRGEMRFDWQYLLWADRRYGKSLNSINGRWFPAGAWFVCNIARTLPSVISKKDLNDRP
jgi:hypothetical protein